MALKRDLNPMPEDVRAALVKRNLVEAYEARPDYQRNDYLGWIIGAKREETRARRLRQMLDELAKGGVYMNMAWKG
ncbi:YdeI/OmpD-associated family protein [Arvimicrobium flavum]|uniref:YdeI/OmpD-associated family protein n=1 Tax=Arvimicrobium flavum TaxID=3393320 RepID=UPI00237A5849|nr:YdeI/OmpD-associated family protein [Mesorhizobium shangrilense]